MDLHLTYVHSYFVLLLDCWLNGVLSVLLLSSIYRVYQRSEHLIVSNANCLRYFPFIKNFLVLIYKTVHVVESSLSCLCAIRRVLTSKAMEQLLLQAKQRLFRRLIFRLVIHKQILQSWMPFQGESGYLTKESEATNLPLNDEVDFLGEL